MPDDVTVAITAASVRCDIDGEECDIALSVKASACGVALVYKEDSP
ncbi:hypothetical protein A2U01_0053848 [Trifolium medium]|uniref:Uncharacterized protein n=1 Tax=Trifolium medium TaxID=97028 RepID=A0A392R9C6_9FABA|nr:hypothetical protein [Trifolium medium]